VRRERAFASLQRNLVAEFSMATDPFNPSNRPPAPHLGGLADGEATNMKAKAF